MRRKAIAFDGIRCNENEVPAGPIRCALPLHRTPDRHEARRVLRRRLDIAAGREAAQRNAHLSGIVQQQEVHAPRAGIAAGRKARLDMYPKIRFQRPEDLDSLYGEGERSPFRRGPVLFKDKADGGLEGPVHQAGMQSIGAGRRRYRIRQAKAGENRALTIRAGSKGKRGNRPVARPIDEAHGIERGIDPVRRDRARMRQLQGRQINRRRGRHESVRHQHLRMQARLLAGRNAQNLGAAGAIGGPR